MKNIKKYLLFSIIVFSAWWVLSTNVVYAANWYVDNAASGSNNGTSWTNAWQTFANTWGNIAPGDTIYISGGTTSKTYTEELWIKDSGTAGNPITFKTGQDAGHNGTVIITVSGDAGIYFSNHSYITISGQVGSGSERKMRITGCGGSGVQILNAATNIRLLYLEVDNNGGANQAGIYGAINFSTGWEIAYCYVHDNYQDAISIISYSPDRRYGANSIHHNILSARDDTIETGMAGIDIYDNVFGPNVCAAYGHADVLALNEGYYRIYNNLFAGIQQLCVENRINAGIYVTQGEVSPIANMGYLKIYNNVFYEPSPTVGNMMNAAITLSIGKIYNATTVNDIYVVNNSIIGHKNAIWTVIYGSGS